LHDGIRLCCNRGGLLFRLALAHRALALSLAESLRFEVRLRFENSELESVRRSGLPTVTSCWPGSAPAASWWT
jgi:hypothetical protein